VTKAKSLKCSPPLSARSFTQWILGTNRRKVDSGEQLVQLGPQATTQTDLGPSCTSLANNTVLQTSEWYTLGPQATTQTDLGPSCTSLADNTVLQRSEWYTPGCIFLIAHPLTRQFNVAGIKFAMLEMKATLSSLLRKYHLLPASPQSHLDLTVVIVLQSLTGVVLRIQPRAKQPANTSEWH